MKYFATIAVLLSVVVLANGLCQRPTLEHRRQHFWEENGQHYSLWYVRVRNPQGADPLNGIYLDLQPRDSFPYQIWGLNLVSNRRYTFPEYVSSNGIEAGQFHEFGYITRSNEASYSPLFFSLYDYVCPASDWCACSLEYAPVCGKNGITYSNHCHASCAGVLKERNGAC